MTNEWFVEERLHIGARCTGAMERLLGLGVEWATGRVQFDQRIYDFQGVAFPLADSAADASAARLLTREAAWMMDQGVDPKIVHARASLAKLFASEAAYRCADRVVQVFGGRGYMREFPAERYLRELRVDRIWEGTSEIQRRGDRPGAREARRAPGRRLSGPSQRPVAEPAPPVIDLRPLFAPRSIAVVGASPRGWLGSTVRDNLRTDGQRDPLLLRQPQVRGGARRAVLAHAGRPPGASRHRDPRGQPAARHAVRTGGGRRRRAQPRDPGRRRGGGRRGRRRDAARGARHRDPARHRAAGAQLHGHGGLDHQQHDLHRRREPVAAARSRGGARPVGERDRRVHPRARDADRVQPDRVRRRRGGPRPVRLPRMVPRRPGDPRGHAVRRGVQAARAVPRPVRPRAGAGQAGHGGQGGPLGAGAGGSRRPQRQSRRRGPGDRCGTRRRGRHPLHGPRRADRGR